MIDPHENSSLSWLTLERLAAGDVSAAERESLERALAADPESARIVERIRADARSLPPLPARAPGRAEAGNSWLERLAGIVRNGRLLAAGGAVAAAAAVLVIWWARPDIQRTVMADIPGPRVHLGDATKGGDVAISLVRERAGMISHDPGSYREGDRFKVLLTCPVGAPLFGDVVVYQDGQDGRGQDTSAEASFPFARIDGPLACGNRVALPGAFTLSAGGVAHVCLVFDAHGAPERSSLEHRETTLSARDHAVCATLAYAPRQLE